MVTLWGKLPAKRRRAEGAEGRAEGVLKSQRCARVCAGTEEVMTASLHLDLGPLLLLLACWQTTGLVGASESLC